MNKGNSLVYRMWEERPLALILSLALFFRLLAAIFSRGYGWHDDHFLIIESSGSWADGEDYNNWLPSSNGGKFAPSGHSFTYPGLHFIFISFLQLLGLDNPQVQMFFIRLVHAVFSLSIVYFGYRLAERFFSVQAARQAGILLALYFFMPFLSVRNLVEFVCIPFLMWGTWLLVKEDKPRSSAYLIAGILFGIAFSLRFQTLFFTAGTGLILLIRHPFKHTLYFALTLALTLLLTQGLVDYLIWKVPFAEFCEYVRYNFASAEDYFVREWYMYIVFLFGILVPPVSVFLFFGFFKYSKRILIIVVPVMLFLVLHSYFPNKQERFVLPVVPFIIALGAGGWYTYVRDHVTSVTARKFIRAGWIFFWCLNLIALPVVSVMYSKRSRVEVMRYLGSKEDLTYYIIEDSTTDKITMLPQFYLGKWTDVMRIKSDQSPEWVYKQMEGWSPGAKPNYMLFMGTQDLEARVKKAGEYFGLRYETTIEPSSMDLLLHKLNPNNKNESISVYKIVWE
jgi:4-amino-4-deoxy-L-arabinose transferase-like glycosyltransferase